MFILHLMVSSVFIHESHQLQILVISPILEKNRDLRDEEAGALKAPPRVWWNTNVTSAIRPGDDPDNDVLRSPFKWDPRCGTGARGVLACVEGRQARAEREVDGKEGAGGAAEICWGEFGEDEEMVWGTLGNGHRRDGSGMPPPHTHTPSPR